VAARPRRFLSQGWIGFGWGGTGLGDKILSHTEFFAFFWQTKEARKWARKWAPATCASGKRLRPLMIGPRELGPTRHWLTGWNIRCKKYAAVLCKKKRESTTEMLPWRRSDGPECLIAVEASCICTNYTFRLDKHVSEKFCLHYVMYYYKAFSFYILISIV
jgi:hypothetical protein